MLFKFNLLIKNHLFLKYSTDSRLFLQINISKEKIVAEKIILRNSVYKSITLSSGKVPLFSLMRCSDNY